MENVDVVVVGAGLSGLSCAFELATAGREVLLLEANAYPGGRTSSWIHNGMAVESGFHRFRGVYQALPALLARAGLDIDEIVLWQNRVELRVPNCRPAFIGIAPRYDPSGVLKTLLGNRWMFSWRDKLSLLHLVAAGASSFHLSPDALDAQNIHSYGHARGVTQRSLERFLIPLTRGVFFRSPEQYSAHAFMMPLAFSLRRLLSMRTGFFRGGMTDVMAQPLVTAIEKAGGAVRTNAPVLSLHCDRKRVTGVELANGSIAAREVVVAVPLGSAKRLLAPLQDEIPSLFQLPVVPAVTVQLDLAKPALPHNAPVFAPGTSLIAFAEESRTSFPRTKGGGRLSVVLSDAERTVQLSDDEILTELIESAATTGLELNDITGHFIQRIPEDFADVRPGCLALRPDQITGVKGLTLAGDFTRQVFLSTMEGAVISGQRAARAVIDSN